MQGTLTVALLLLLIAAAVGLIAKRLRIPYNVALVLAGALLGTTQAVPRVGLQPGIVLQVFLPILLYEATLATDLRRLRENLMPVVVLAVPGVFTTLVVAGAILHAGLGLAWPVAFLLGAALASTDTIAVIASLWEALTPTGKVAIRSVWEVAAFGVNSVLFLLIGLQEDFRSLMAYAGPVGGGLLALTIGRAAAVYPLPSRA
jgi:monovalent cation:H+ antiporter, CPA1 family